MWLRLLLVWHLCAALVASAHPLDDASLEIRPAGEQLQVVWTVPPGVGESALRLGSAALQVHSRARQDSGHVRYQGTLPLGEIDFEYTAWPPQTIDSPRCILVVQAAGGAVSAVLTPEQPRFRLRQSAWSRARGFFRLGVEHIVTGGDHLLFLLTLLLPGGSWVTHLKTVSAFTLAHSLTLSLSVLGYLSLPSGPVEIVIALSIAVAALWNLYPRPQGRRWPLALVFGLVHGLGFAGALHERGVAGRDAVVPLLSFNLGVEAGQLRGTAGLPGRPPVEPGSRGDLLAAGGGAQFFILIAISSVRVLGWPRNSRSAVSTVFNRRVPGVTLGAKPTRSRATTEPWDR